MNIVRYLKCSIVIPYYKNREPLIHTLNSLRDQSFSSSQFEVIVVDDGESDAGLKEALHVFDCSFDLKYYSYENNRGSAFARNFGSSTASGEIIIFLDSDQVVKQDFIEQHVKFFEHIPHDKQVLQIGLRNEISDVLIANELSIHANSLDARFSIFERYSENMQRLRGAWHICFSHNISLRKATLTELGGFDEEIFQGWGLEDSEFAYRLQKNNVKIVYNPNILVYHISHELHWNSLHGYELWNRNLSAFCEKHNDCPVLVQAIFRDFFNPVVRKERLEQGDKRPWITCFSKFEQALRALDKVAQYNDTLYLKDVDVLHLKNLLSVNSQINYVLIVSKNNIEIISFVQIFDEGKDIMLFTY